MRDVRLVVPIAPGEGAINRRFVSVARGRMVTAKRYRSFTAAVAEQAQAAAAVHGRFEQGEVAVAIVEYWPRLHRTHGNAGIAFGDVDAPVKAVLDGLKAGGLLDDDARVVEVHAKKRVDAACPRVLVAVWQK